mgnify:CR=1 FL=1
MTENEAIEDLSENLKMMIEVITQFKCFEKSDEEALVDRIRRKESLEAAIEALKEVQKYRKIGTVEECRKAVDDSHKSHEPVRIYDRFLERDPCEGCMVEGTDCEEFNLPGKGPCLDCAYRRENEQY